MKMELTDNEIRQAMTLAVNAAAPAGLGYLYYNPKKFTAHDFDDVDVSKGFYLDYVEGRMTKLSLRRNQDGTWEIPDNDQKPDVDYQSWCGTYPTYRALIEEAQRICRG
jgi:hypothetical protein